MSGSRGRVDTELMALAQEGDREAFASLYGRYWVRAVRTATVVCGSNRSARDVVRVAFGEGWKTRDTYRPERESVHSWLFGIVRQVATFSREGDDLWGRVRFADDQVELDSDDADTTANTDVGTDAADAIAALLAGAPDDQREAIALAFFGELSPVEIANHLNLTEESVEGRIRFGLEELRTRDFAPPPGSGTDR